MVKNINTVYFDKNVFDSEMNFIGKKPVLIDFHAPWCGPCKMLEQTLKDIDKEYGKLIDIYKINTEEEQELSASFGIRSIPTLLFIPIGDTSPFLSPGAPDYHQLEQWIKEKLLNT